MTWHSALEFAPDYEAIGMISIENSNMEIALAGLFGRVCFISQRVAIAIYLTPNSAFARIAVFEKAAEAALAPRDGFKGVTDQAKRRQDCLDRTLKIASKARSLIGKRHQIIHEQWGISGDEVHRRPLGAIEYTPMPINELTDLVGAFRNLIQEIVDLDAEFHAHPPTLTDLRLP